MYNEKLCEDVRSGKLAIENTDWELSEKLLAHIWPHFTSKIKEKVRQFLVASPIGSWNAWFSTSYTTLHSLPVKEFFVSEEKEVEKGITQNAAAQNYAVNKTHPFNKLFTKLTDAFIAGVEWQKTIKS